MKATPILTIDGPGGSGKGTIGLRVAKALGWHFLDSGALYRVLAFAALQQGVDFTDEDKLADLGNNLSVQFNSEVLFAGQPVTHAIRTETCGDIASKIAIFPKVRSAILERLRAFARMPGLVADGRDMGTVVFPGAFLKIFLEASVEERAKRRYLQLKEKGENVTLERLLEEVAARDARDKGRVIAPLLPAKDAVVIDTTGMGVEAVFERVMNEVKHSFSI